MNRFFTLLLSASCLTAVGQVTYPYNPDGNADGDIAVGDLQDFLGTYGNPFSPSEIIVGDSSLTYWVEQLSQTVQEQQEMIELLKGGDSRSLLYPDGLGSVQAVHHDFISELHAAMYNTTQRISLKTSIEQEIPENKTILIHIAIQASMTAVLVR